jgi:predicted GIY-YIG superfamily endonuclease
MCSISTYHLSKLQSYCWVYVIRLRYKDGHYIGSTSNLLRRVREHQEMKESAARSIMRYGFGEVVWTHPTVGREEAYLLECYLFRCTNQIGHWVIPNKERYRIWRRSLSPEMMEEIIHGNFGMTIVQPISRSNYDTCIEC